ncbi:FAD-dependent monooxygenase [Streptomyces sp. NPDC058469]|uniref:FAD-dependent monooxygenase n=1 Tax=Streptomyces sp. NPDC058469 TaxID=3346514 RepID=UPI0036483CD7
MASAAIEERPRPGGDSVDVRFPAGGQALSAAPLDALNLGWKLARIVQGVADRWPPTTADTYDRGRRSAMQQVVNNTQSGRPQAAGLRARPGPASPPPVFCAR